MTFTLFKIFWNLFSPDNLIVIACVLTAIGLWLPFQWAKRWAKYLVSLLAITLLLIVFLPVGSWMLAPLEDRFPPPEKLPEQVDGIIVLGGALSPVLSKGREQPALNAAAERLTSFYVLSRKYPEAKLIFTGGSGYLFNPDDREADWVKPFLTELGLPESRVLYDRNSRNTHENVKYSKELAGYQPGQTWLLVTSATHMPRSVGVFRQQNWPVIAYPVDYLTTGKAITKPRLNLHESLTTLKIAVREWIGLTAYYSVGYTNSLFPGPEKP